MDKYLIESNQKQYKKRNFKQLLKQREEQEKLSGCATVSCA